MRPRHNQRKFSRSQITISAMLTPEDGQAFGVQVDDLSMGGIFVLTDRKLEIGRKCKVNMLLGHFKHELPLIAEAAVVRITERGLALKFEVIELEAISSMGRLVIEHSDNPEQARMEFSAHGGWVFSPD